MGEVLQAPHVVEVLSGLPRGSWVVVDRVAWPTPALASPDCVVIGPGGMFVVVAVDPGDRPATVLLDAPWVDGEFRGDLVERTRDATAAVLALAAGFDPRRVRGVLCFTQEPMLVEHCDDVLVCSTANLVSLLTSRTPVLDTRQVHTVHARLRAGLRRASTRLDQVPSQRPGVSSRRPARGVLVGAAVAVALLVAAGLGLAAAELDGARGGVVGAGALAGSSLPPRVGPLGRPLTVSWPGGPGEVRAVVRAVHRVGDGRQVEVRLVLAAPGRRSWRGDLASSVWLVTDDGRRFRARGPRGLVTVPPGAHEHTAVLARVPQRARIARVELRPRAGAAAVAAWRLR